MRRSTAAGSRRSAPLIVCLAPAVALAGCGSSASTRLDAPGVGGSERARVELQGHRGARGLAPENTLEGFREALAIGVDTLELDCGLTRDGILVVHHDSHLSVDLTRDPRGAWLTAPTRALHALDAAELAGYDVGRLRPGSEYAAKFPMQRGRDGVRIPRLGEVFDLAEKLSSSRIEYNIETKLSPDEPDATASPEVLADALVAIARERGLASRVTVQSFDWRSLQHLRQVAPELSLACLTSEDPEGDTIQRGSPGPSPWTAGFDIDDHGGSVPALVAAAGCSIWSPRLADLSAAELGEAHELGLRVAVWTVNEPNDVDAALELGVDSIISDHPDRVRAALERRGQPTPPRFAE